MNTISYTEVSVCVRVCVYACMCARAFAGHRAHNLTPLVITDVGG